MTRVAAVAGAMLLVLGAMAAVVLIGHDTTVFVSPPEAVAENFVRKLVARGEMGDAIPGDAVPNDVVGEQATIKGDRATATVTIHAPGRMVSLLVELRRAPEGVWRVTEWRGA